MRFGYYPEAVLADQIYRNRDNRAFCKNAGIRLIEPRLGRPKAGKNKDQRTIEFRDRGERNAVEVGFGVDKRKYGLAQIMAYLKETAESVIMLQFIVMNLEHRLRVLFLSTLQFLFKRGTGFV